MTDQHRPDCRWEQTTSDECQYRDTHHYCPHPEHACTCPPIPRFSPNVLPHPADNWTEWRKKVTTRMVRIDGPFIVDTSEGPLRCADGWLAMDARGYPYPIAADEQALIYEPVQP